MNVARAWAPGNISLIFQVVSDSDPTVMGSKGVGFTINEGTIVEVTKGNKVITYNGHGINLPTVSELIKSLTSKSLSITITSPLPLGSGFGISGASALAAAYAINKLLGLGKTDLELAKLAHRAEVISKTGLGDVVNEYFGGFFVKFVPSSRFEVEKLPIAPIPIYCKSHGKLLTSSVLTDTAKIQKINREAEKALKHIKRDQLSFARITAIANEFTRKAGLQTPEVSKQIEDIEASGGHAAQILLGNAVVSDIPFPAAMKLSMDTKKAMVLWSR